MSEGSRLEYASGDGATVIFGLYYPTRRCEQSAFPEPIGVAACDSSYWTGLAELGKNTNLICLRSEELILTTITVPTLGIYLAFSKAWQMQGTNFNPNKCKEQRELMLINPAFQDVVSGEYVSAILRIQSPKLELYSPLSPDYRSAKRPSLSVIVFIGSSTDPQTGSWIEELTAWVKTNSRTEAASKAREGEIQVIYINQLWKELVEPKPRNILCSMKATGKARSKPKWNPLLFSALRSKWEI